MEPRWSRHSHWRRGWFRQNLVQIWYASLHSGSKCRTSLCFSLGSRYTICALCKWYFLNHQIFGAKFKTTTVACPRGLDFVRRLVTFKWKNNFRYVVLSYSLWKIQFKRGKFKFQVVKIVVIEFGIHMVDNFSVQVNTIIRSLRFLGPQMASFLLLALTIR